MSSVYQVITDRILSSLEGGVVPWRKSWASGMPANLVSGREYRGVNRLLLACTDYESNLWLTFNQCRAAGGSIRRGSKGMPVIYWNVRDSEDLDGRMRRDFILRYFVVFNVAQTERLSLPPAVVRKPFDVIARCEAIVANYQGGPRIEHGGSRAYYSPLEDRVQMPPRASFFSAPDYYSTLFHELSHSTGSKSRLNRLGVADVARFDRHESYALEELVAEIASAFLAADASIAPLVLDQSAAYIAGWLKSLHSDPKMVIVASALAQRATELILGREARAEEAMAEAA